VRRTCRFHLFKDEEGLLNWQLSYRLNRLQLLAPVVQHMELEGATGLRLRRLYTVIKQNLSAFPWRRQRQTLG
jgi:hypothetical protein